MKHDEFGPQWPRKANVMVLVAVAALTPLWGRAQENTKHPGLPSPQISKGNLAENALAGEIIDGTQAGAIGDGTTLNTLAIQKAIDECAANGGGKVSFPPGRYLTGTIQIKSNVTLHLEEGATLLGSTNVADYHNLDPFIDGSGNPLGHALIVAVDAENVGIEGKGIIDGQSPALKATQPLVIKATSASKPSRDIVASNCKLSTRTNAIKLGTESIGGFENISVSNCQIRDTKMAGIALYAVDGADLRHVTISDITMDGVIVPISIRLGKRLKSFRAGEQARATPGRLHDVVIKNVSAKNIQMIGLLINGVPGYPVEALTLENVDLELPGGGRAEDAKIQLPEKEAAYPEFDTWGLTMPASSIYIRHARGIKFKNVKTRLLQPDARPTTVFIDAEEVTTDTAQA